MIQKILDHFFPPPPKPVVDHELETRILLAQSAVARHEEANKDHKYVEPKECNKLHPHPDMLFEYSEALGMRYQECPSCGMISGYMAA